jgi:localization factor PodJL
MPWSVKGVTPEAREVAKLEAQKSGMTIGAWLSEVIVEAGKGGASRMSHNSNGTTAIYADMAALPPGITPAMLAELPHIVLAIAKRLANLENDTVEFAASFQDQLSDVRHKITTIQQKQAQGSAMTF